MAFRLKLGPRLEKDARRLLVEQIDKAEAELAGHGDAPRAIHETRKSMKRIRSLLRLLKPGLRRAWFAQEDERFRDIARALSQLRDNHVIIETLAKLEQASDENTKDALAAARAAFAQKTLAAGPVADQKAVVTGALAGLAAARTSAEKLHIAPARIETLAEGLAQVYRDGKRQFKEQRAHPTDEGLHDLRKSIQHHWRHLQILSAGWPELYEVRITTAKSLAEQLGTDHDMSVLAAAVQALPPRALPARQRTAVIQRARQEQDSIRRAYVPLAFRLFAESPEEIARAAVRHWAAGAKARAAKSKGEPAASNVTEIDAALAARRVRHEQPG